MKSSSGISPEYSLDKILALGLVAALAAGATSLSAQDVEMLGRIYGTRPPEAYYRLKGA